MLLSGCHLEHQALMCIKCTILYIECQVLHNQMTASLGKLSHLQAGVHFIMTYDGRLCSVSQVDSIDCEMVLLTASCFATDGGCPLEMFSQGELSVIGICGNRD